MDNATLTIESRGHVLLMGLNRPHKRNAFNIEMFRALASAYGMLDEDPQLRCGVLFAHGDHFTGGIDLPEWGPVFAQGRGMELPLGSIDPLGVDPLRRVRKPIVIAVQGWCLTIGLELLLACDIRVAADSTRLAQLEVKRGIYAIGGATLRMPREMGWGNAMRYLLTGDEIPIDLAQRLGLVQEVVPHGRQLETAVELAERVARQAPLAVQASLRSARMAVAQGENAAIKHLAGDLAGLLSTADAREGLVSFLERREGKFVGE